MRKINLFLSILLAVVLTAGLALAHGLGGAQAGWPGGGMGGWPGHQGYANLLKGTPFSFEGEVVSNHYHGGGGLVLSTADGQALVYGLGPFWYWRQLGIDYPLPGEIVSVQVYTVDTYGSDLNILMSITLADGQSVQLRNPETGWPLWMNSSM